MSDPGGGPPASGGGGGGGGGAKAGLAIGLVAVLGMAGRLVDDCGRVAVHGASHGDELVRGAAHAGDELARGSKPGAKLLGAGLGDEGARGARPAALGGEALGEGTLVKVVDDAAPGTGTSVEEALRDAGLELAFELLPMDGVPDDPSDAPDAPGATPVQVLESATGPGAREDFETGVGAGAIVVVVGALDARGTFAFGDERIDDRTMHTRCMAVGARCVVLTCPETSSSGCVPLAERMGRIAAARVPAAGSPTARSVLLASALLRSRAELRAREIVISRVDAGDGVMIRSRMGP